MIRTVSFVASATEPPIALARFELSGHAVAAEYFDDDFRALVEGWSIRPDAGDRFIAELDRVFGRSSRILLGDS